MTSPFYKGRKDRGNQGINMSKLQKKDFIRAKIHAHISPGESLKIIRELQKLSKNELSKLTGISQSNLSALENDFRQMGRDRALVLAKALRVHPAVLVA
jgi:DNA-binding transcriptional regulator YiaG